MDCLKFPLAPPWILPPCVTYSPCVTWGTWRHQQLRMVRAVHEVWRARDRENPPVVDHFPVKNHEKTMVFHIPLGL